MKKILLIFGTRPEAIKMAPLVLEFKKEQNNFDIKICVTGQHRSMLDQVMKIFKLKPDFDLNLMKVGQSLSDITSGIIQGLSKVFNEWKPDIVLVHGDTATTFAASLSAYYHQISIGHIEAGLRTGNLYSPWPEEGNRKLTSVLSHYHFAPTEEAKMNLLKENVDSKKIFVTGNTVIDALFIVKKMIDTDISIQEKMREKFNFLEETRKVILVTGHRRENFGKGFINICTALMNIAKNNPTVQIVYPVHLNPNVQKPVKRLLSGIDNLFLIEPQEYLPFVYLMSKSYLILTDSGGIQEEAPSLGKPVLVMRNTTERPEAIKCGGVKLVGTEVENIEKNVINLLNNKNLYKKMSEINNPYGDGNSARKIVDILR